MLTKTRNTLVASLGLNVLLCQIYKCRSLGYTMTYIITNHINNRNGPVLSLHLTYFFLASSLCVFFHCLNSIPLNNESVFPESAMALEGLLD